MKYLLKFRDSNNGVAAIEFALILPILLIIFFGMAIYSNYALVSRKIDSAANDIAAIIAKEGRIANQRSRVSSSCPPLSGGSYTEYTGGSAYLDASDGMIKSLMPILIFPLNYNFETNTKIPIQFEYDVLMAGIPLWSKINQASGGSPSAGYGVMDLAIMWEQASPGASFSTSFSGSTMSFTGISTDVLFRADIPGQAFLALGIEYPYDQGGGYFASLLGGAELVGLNFTAGASFAALGSGFSIAKASAYPVRPSNINAAGNLIPYNDLNICTDCNVLTSNTVSPPCKTGCTNFQFDTNVSGCGFD